MSDKILTLHPAGMQGVNIDLNKYNTIKQALLAIVEHNPSISFSELVAQMSEGLGNRFDGSISWYTTTVKLDLEARGLIERIPGAGPQRLRLSSQAGNPSTR